MRALVKVGLFSGLFLMGGAAILIYSNIRLFYQAEKIEQDDRKIALLQRANNLFPFNDLIHYGLGKGYLNQARGSLSSTGTSKALLEKAVESLNRAINLNPASPFSHFYLGQTLLQLSVFSPISNESYLQEFRRAAELTGPNTQIFYEVGKIFLSLWPRLSERDRNYAISLVKEIIVGKNKERILSLMSAWELNVGDLETLTSFFPMDEDLLRIYGDYLGERGLSLEVRQNALAKAEFLRFERAEDDFRRGEQAAFYHAWDEAAGRFEACLNRLKTIYFYQDLISQRLIDPEEFSRTRASAVLNLAKSLLEAGKQWPEAEDYFREYLSLEGGAAAVSELDDYLRAKKVIEAQTLSKLNDLGLLSFQLLVYLKEDRYDEVMKYGRHLRESLIVVPGEMKSDYVHVLRLIGDAFQRSNYPYEAADFFQKALEVEPNNIETLVAIRQNYERLNNEAKAAEIAKKIQGLASLEINLGNFSLGKGRSFSRALALDGRPGVLSLQFDAQGLPPVVTVFFNDLVVAENVCPAGSLTVSTGSRVGKNVVRIMALNRSLTLVRLSYRYDVKTNRQ
ncbi:MAG: hypothetical protein AB1715_07915 [Acidobacteriota bacterium]